MPGSIGPRATLMLACAGLVLTACVTGSSDDTPPPPPPPPPPASLTGVWNFALVVTVATGVCQGEEGDAGTDPITITQTGSSAPYTISARGFLGSANNQLTGTLNSANVLSITGSYAEDGGITTTTYTLTRSGENQMTGTEAWNWVGGGGDCPGSASSVVATRVD